MGAESRGSENWGRDTENGVGGWGKETRVGNVESRNGNKKRKQIETRRLEQQRGQEDGIAIVVAGKNVRNSLSRSWDELLAVRTKRFGGP